MADALAHSIEAGADYLDKIIGSVGRAVPNARALQVSDPQPGADGRAAGDPDDWQEAMPLVAKVAAQAYPVDALPDTIRKAVEEVQGFTKAPIPLVASSALAAVSVTVQTYVDVQRADKLQGPVSLSLVSIADSGERKTTCDGFFSTAIRDYQAQQIEAAKPGQTPASQSTAFGADSRSPTLEAIT